MIVHYQLLPVCKFHDTSAIRHKPKEPSQSLVRAHQMTHEMANRQVESASPVLQWRRMKPAWAESRIANAAPVSKCSTAATGRRGNSLPNSLVIPALLLAGLLGCRHSGPPVENEGPDSLGLTSSSLPDGRFPASLTCDGINTSPALAWNAPPAGTGSLALILNDRDLPNGFVHWVLFNLPPGSRSLPASLPAQAELPDGARQGANDFGKIGYGGPCPSGTHHYAIMLFALDSMLTLPAGASRAQLDAAMNGHVLARGELVASYYR